MTNFFNDFKVGIRLAFKNLGSVVFAVVAYSIGLGLVALMLALIYGIAKGKPDYQDIDRLYHMRWDPDTQHLWTQGNQFEQWRIHTFRDFQEAQSSFEDLSASVNMRLSVVKDGYANLASGLSVTEDFFRTMGIKPHLGRLFNEDEGGPDSPKVVVLGYDYWMKEFAGSRSAVGSSLTLNGIAYTVIGVASEGFDFPAEVEMWIPRVRGVLEKRGEGYGYLVVGRLKEGVPIGTANAEFNTIAKNLEATYPDTNTGFVSVRIERLDSMYIDDNLQTQFNIMLACSGLVLLIACANVANLLLSRTILRTRELAIRSSLGATRSRLVYQMLVEGLVIAILGGIGGWGVGEYASRMVWDFVVNGNGVTLPSWMHMNIDWRVMLSLVGVTILACIAAGLLPALKASKTNMNEVLKDSGRSSTSMSLGWFSRVLVFLQLSFSLGLLVVTGAMVKTVTASEEYNPPYEKSRMLIARLDLNEASYPSGPKQIEFRRQFKEKLDSIPGVTAAGFSSAFDMMYNWNSIFKIEGSEYDKKEDYPTVRNEVISNDYFEKMGIPILEGRGFLDTDTPDKELNAVLANTHLAEKFWPGESAVGKRLKDVWSDEFPWVTIVAIDHTHGFGQILWRPSFPKDV
ncbi:MAG: ABC transporter permease, partial [Verrucomicrobiota bacterium]